jgi:hypothetical protein
MGVNGSRIEPIEIECSISLGGRAGDINGPDLKKSVVDTLVQLVLPGACGNFTREEIGADAASLSAQVGSGLGAIVTPHDWTVGSCQCQLAAQ